MKRTKISESIEAEVLFKTDLKCCICKKRGDHIHHIDSNPSNNNIENLVFLCFEHHNQATITNSLSRTLKPKTILRFRNHHYSEVEAQRNLKLSNNDKPILHLSEDTLFSASLSASIIIEILKIKEEYFNSIVWEKKNAIFNKMYKFSEHASYRVSVEVFDFLSILANTTRNDMPSYFSHSIFSFILAYYGRPRNKEDFNENFEFANQCINIGHSISYDAAIHLVDLKVLSHGLSILKYVYIVNKEFDIKKVIKMVLNTFDELYETCQSRKRDDLQEVIELINIYKKDLNEHGLSYPKMPEYLFQKLIS